MLSRVSGVSRIDGVGYRDLLSRYAEQPVDVVLVGTPGESTAGVEVIRRLIAAQRGVNVVVFGAPGDARAVAMAIAVGARGFLRWDASHPDTFTSVTYVVAGALAGGAAVTGNGGQRRQITEREMQVLRGMSEGRSNCQIGRELGLSEDTVKTYARRLFSTLDVGDRAEAVAEGFRHGLVS
jgi:DNA-binding NarL/FixJ family response regulator